ncbi:hypothetical protein Tco_1014105 [Tanacetum coccineum]
MASLDHRLNPLFSIKECITCGALYTADFCCSKGGLEDKILVPKPPQNCATCGNPGDGSYCRSCTFVRRCLNEGWYTIHDENEILNTSKSSENNTNVVSAPQESFSCGNGAHIGYNCPPKVLIISNPEQCNQTIAEPRQTLLSVHPTCNYEDENSFIYDSKPHSFNVSPSVLTYPPQLQFETYLCELLEIMLIIFPVNYPPQETSREILQAQEDLMEAIQAFLKEYDHIPPNEKCMALLLADERFLKIKQTMKEEQNQPEVMQELLLKLMDDLQSLKGSQHEKKETATQSLIPYWNSLMIDDEEARDNFLKDVCTFLRKFSRIPFGVTPKHVESLCVVKNIRSRLLKLIFFPRISPVNSALFPPGMDEDEFDEGRREENEDQEEIEPDQGGLTSVVISDNSNNHLLELPEFESFHFNLDPLFPRPPPEPPDVEISLIIETDALVINNFDELNEDE